MSMFVACSTIIEGPKPRLAWGPSSCASPAPSHAEHMYTGAHPGVSGHPCPATSGQGAWRLRLAYARTCGYLVCMRPLAPSCSADEGRMCSFLPAPVLPAPPAVGDAELGPRQGGGWGCCNASCSWRLLHVCPGQQQGSCRVEGRPNNRDHGALPAPTSTNTTPGMRNQGHHLPPCLDHQFLIKKPTPKTDPLQGKGTMETFLWAPDEEELELAEERILQLLRRSGLGQGGGGGGGLEDDDGHGGEAGALCVDFQARGLGPLMETETDDMKWVVKGVCPGGGFTEGLCTSMKWLDSRMASDGDSQSGPDALDECTRGWTGGGHVGSSGGKRWGSPGVG